MSFGKFLAGLIAPVVVTVVVNTLGLLVIYARRLSKKRLRGRLEEEAAKNEGLKEARNEPTGQEIVEGLGSEPGSGGCSREGNGPRSANGVELVSSEKWVRSGNPTTSGEREVANEDRVTDSGLGVVHNLSAEHFRNGSLLPPRRSLSLGAKRRWWEDWSDGSFSSPQFGKAVKSVPEYQRDRAGDRSLSSQSSGVVVIIDQETDDSLAHLDRSNVPPAKSDGSPAVGAHSDGLRTRPNSRAHQVEVLVPFPDLEHREGVPAVAPTWRGRLKLLRKKRPPWLFKASVYVVVVGMLAALLAGLDLPWVAMGAAVILICLDFRDAEDTLDQVSPALSFGSFILVEYTYQWS